MDLRVESRVIGIVDRLFNGQNQPLVREMSLRGDLRWDSIDLINFVMEVEDEFDMSIPDDDMLAWRTLGDAIDYVKRMKEISE